MCFVDLCEGLCLILGWDKYYFFIIFFVISGCVYDGQESCMIYVF